jgi:transcriptional antiterminator NusG
MIDKKWYALRVTSGKERKTKEYIENYLNKDDSINSITKYVHNIVLPLEKVYKVRNGKKYSSDRNFYPGYILIETNMSGEVLHVIEKMPNVIYFIKEDKKPIPLRDSEVKIILDRVDELTNNKTKIDIPFLVGEMVKITNGPFISFNGEITSINIDKKKLKLNVKIFGRETSLEVGFLQVDKI